MPIAPDPIDTLELNPAFAPLFQTGARAYLDAWAAEMKAVYVTAGEAVVDADNPLDGIWIVTSDEAVITAWRILGVERAAPGTMGEVFGAHGMTAAFDSLTAIIATNDGYLYNIPRDGLDRLAAMDPQGCLTSIGQILGGSVDYADIADQLTAQELLLVSPVFRNLTLGVRAQVATAARWVDYAAGDVIVRPTDEDEGLYVVDEGDEVTVAQPTPRWGEVQYALGFGGVVGRSGVPSPVGSEQQPRVRVTATGTVRTLFISPHTVRRLLRTADDGNSLERTLQNHAAVTGHSTLLTGALADEPPFHDVSPSKLFPLLQGVSVRLWRGGGHPPAPVGDVTGFNVVLSGELIVYASGSISIPDARLDTGQNFVPFQVVRPPGVAGALEAAGGFERLDHWCTRGPAWAAWFAWDTVERTLATDPSFQANVLRVKEDARRLLAERQRIARTELRPVLMDFATREGPRVHGAVGPTRTQVFLPAPGVRWTPAMQVVVDRVALQITRDFDESVIRLDLAPEGTPAREHEDGALLRLTVPVADSQHAMVTAIVTVLETYRAFRASHVLVVPDPALSAGCELGQVVDGAVYFNANPQTGAKPLNPLPTKLSVAVPLLYVVFLPPKGLIIGDEADAFPATACRMTIDLDRLADEPTAVDAYPADLARLARAVTGRRVGVALGGGGAWGFAHLAVLRGMQRIGVPIDCVSGASFGAVVGAFWCARGDDGLQFLLDNGKELQFVVTASGLTSVILQDWVDDKLDGVRLEQLAVPFLPVCADITTASMAAVRTGTLGYGVRASSSFVPIFPVTPTATAEYVDGGYVANVPTWLLRPEGSRLIIASNIVPPPELRRPRTPLLPGTLGQVLYDLNLLGRLSPLVDAGLTLFYSVGDLETANTPVYFDQEWTNNWFFQFADGLQIVRDASALPSFQQTLRGLYGRWEAMKAPKRPPAP